MRHTFTAYLGWYGVAAILAAYVLVTFNIIHAKSYPYQLLNLTGAIGLMVEAASKKDRQPVVLNIVWAVVAVIAISQLILH